MATDDAAARVTWSILAEPGDVVAGELIAHLGAEDALRAVQDAMCSGAAALAERLDAGVSFADDPSAVHAQCEKALARWRPRLPGADPGRAVAAGAAVGARLVVPGDPTWPLALDDLGPHAPFVLWSRAAHSDPLARAGHAGQAGNAQRAAHAGCSGALAVVGCRANTVAGAEAAAEITSTAVDAGLEIVSGGAYGIDAVAHRVAVAAGTPTTAVLAGGVDQFYPAGNHDLLRAVSECGRVLSESPPGTRPSRWRFLARNRMIAALAGATVVAEAAARSGALNTAHHAAQLGRPVFAVPGAFASAASVGCHRLVADGSAQIVVEPRDPVVAVLADAAGMLVDAVRTAVVLGTDTDPHVRRALDALERRPLSVTEVARRSGLSVDDAADALALAQLEGLARSVSDGWSRA